MSESTLLTVNGEEIRVDADPRTPLLLALRNHLGLVGARAGCAIGECGSCTVLADGESVRSCLLALGDTAGVSVVTPEGLGSPDKPDPVQQAFLDEQAAQCGYCINGMIMTVAGLRAHEGVTAEQLRTALDEHLCRCGAHARILRAGCRALGLDTGPDAAEVLSERESAAIEGAHPAVLGAYPRVESWLRLGQDGLVQVLTGKVELGQGIRTAMTQIAAAQLGLAVEQVVVCPASTSWSPDEGYTAGSNSVDDGGAAVGAAAVAFRRLLLERAAELLGAPASMLAIGTDGRIVGDAGCATFAELAASGPITGPIEPDDRPQWDAAPLSRPLARDDLRAKLTGAPAYVHDLRMDGMLHARAVLPPNYAARLRSLDTQAIAAMPGVEQVIVDGSLVIVLAEQEEQARFAASRLAQSANWNDPGLRAKPDDPDVLRELPREPFVAVQTADAPSAAGPTIQATYRRPYQAHASVAPSCAVAVTMEDGRTRIWTHAQGIFPLRRELAALFGEPDDAFELRHRDGPGCYGQNLADDAAAFAAVAARSVPGRPVRFQFAVEDEFAWEPYGSAMIADLSAQLDDGGGIAVWRHRGLTDSHSGTRPDGRGTALVPGWLRAGGTGRDWAGPAEGGARNSIPIYAVPWLDVVVDHVQGPLRSGSLRSLGSFHHVFAIESFMDELAELAGADPVAFRLQHLDDPRARRVLEVAAERIGWVPRVGPSGRGLGIALSRYKDKKAYVAQGVEVAVDSTDGSFAVTRIVTVCDAGAIVNQDGLVNQLEGGTFQGLSRTLFERIEASEAGITSRDWTTYPVLRFRHVPLLETVVLDTAPNPPLGSGEASTPPVPAAVANAIDDAIGIRLRDLPLTAKQLEQRLLNADATEMERVMLS